MAIKKRNMKNFLIGCLVGVVMICFSVGITMAFSEYPRLFIIIFVIFFILFYGWLIMRMKEIK